MVSIAVALFLVVALLWVSVLLTPFDAPAQVLHAPAAAAAQQPAAKGISGTLASFAALFPQLANVYLPAIER